MAKPRTGTPQPQREPETWLEVDEADLRALAAGRLPEWIVAEAIKQLRWYDGVHPLLQKVSGA